MDGKLGIWIHWISVTTWNTIKYFTETLRLHYDSKRCIENVLYILSTLSVYATLVCMWVCGYEDWYLQPSDWNALYLCTHQSLLMGSSNQSTVASSNLWKLLSYSCIYLYIVYWKPIFYYTFTAFSFSISNIYLCASHIHCRSTLAICTYSQVAMKFAQCLINYYLESSTQRPALPCWRHWAIWRNEFIDAFEYSNSMTTTTSNINKIYSFHFELLKFHRHKQFVTDLS